MRASSTDSPVQRTVLTHGCPTLVGTDKAPPWWYNQNAIIYWGLLTIFGGYWLVACMAAPDAGIVNVAYVAAGIFGCYVLLHTLVLLHELGHAMMGALLGMRVDGITIGAGRLLGTIKLGRFRVAVHAWPFSGMTHLYPISERFLRLKQTLMTAAGPLMDLAVLIAALLLYPRPDPFELGEPGASLRGAFFLRMIVILQALGLLRGLWPAKAWMGGRWIPNDGLLIRTMLFPGRVGRLELTFVSGTILCAQGKFDAARSLYLNALKRDGLGTDERTKLLDALACIPLYYSCPHYLPEADEWSRQALEIEPASLTLKGTRGSILLLRERTAEAKCLLAEVFDQSPSALDRSISACFLALAAAREGDFTGADDMLARAKQIAPACIVLGNVTEEITRLREIPAVPSSRSDP